MYAFRRAFFKYRTKSLHICINRTKTRIEPYITLNGANFLKWTIVHYKVHIKISFAVSKIVNFSEILTHQK